MRIAQTFISLFSILLIWSGLVALLHLPPYILPTPFEVVQVFQHSYPILIQHSLTTLFETIMGLLLGTTLGITLALSLKLSKFVRAWLLPLILISQAIPTFAIAPLLVMWLGYGMASKLLITMLMIFFPIASSFYDGLQNTPKAYLELAQVMQSRRWCLLWYIEIPAALPHLASGLRMAAAFAPMGAVIGEWVGANQGLGYLMLNSNARMQIDLMFASLIVIVVMALGLYAVVDWGLKKVIYW